MLPAHPPSRPPHGPARLPAAHGTGHTPGSTRRLARFAVRLVALCVLLGVAGCEFDTAALRSVGDAAVDEREPGVPAEAVRATVVDVTDGDTIEVRLRGEVQPVRLIGVDTPEVAWGGREAECYGTEATERMEALLPEGSVVYLERDVSDTDRYGRLLRYVWLPDGNGEASLVNEVLAAEGYAIARTYPPDDRYEDRFAEAEAAAAEEELGLWRACDGVAST